MDERTPPTAGTSSSTPPTGAIQPVQPPASQALTTVPASNSTAPLASSGSPAVDPQVLAMRERSIIDGILTNESLTADLDDEAAQEVIDWSIAMAREAVQQTAGLEEHQAEKAVSERMYTHRKLMRAVKRLALEKDSLDDGARAELIDQIRSQSKSFYGEELRAEANRDELLRIAREPSERPVQAVTRLRRALNPRADRTDLRSEARNARGE